VHCENQWGVNPGVSRFLNFPQSASLRKLSRCTLRWLEPTSP